MIKTVKICDIFGCNSAKNVETLKIQVIFTADAPVPFLTTNDLEICEDCKQNLLKGHALYNTGHNTFKFKEVIQPKLMTDKEQKIVRKYGPISYTVYSYIKANKNTPSWQICEDLAINRRSLYRHLMNLKQANIIEYVGENRNTTYTARTENEWKL